MSGIEPYVFYPANTTWNTTTMSTLFYPVGQPVAQTLRRERPLEWLDRMVDETCAVARAVAS